MSARLNGLNNGMVLDRNTDMGLIARRSCVFLDSLEIWRCKGNMFTQNQWSYLGFVPHSEYTYGMLKEASTIYNLLKEKS